ncbi:monovalent cation:H+ antiporter-2, CPA2 family [Allopseudospirillum japonicum]|uniref:Monovalent cation:H+ antiporter-2, CPA2 family n=1 Tax=Allopseudospirillum japonicum TaxID=64971 RepID=A0A1H6RY67_9GAMM|nr:monovalent cation:proton antiporter-2 (CPA2) family protein [Allopseudospirillum japonicum]SEI56730.1 monovalent cation:H+ antiporter-2, CPA2 family [Allopseudospirillum japonicum]
MALAIAAETFNDVMVILSASVVASAIFSRWRLPPVLAYLAVGCLIGPHAMGWIEESKNIAFLSEFGLVFLLFSLGLEFSLPRMYALRKTVFGLGGAQVVLCTLLFWVVLHFLGMSWETALIAAGALALSSTAIVSQELTRWGEINTPHGHASIGILLFQDIAAVVFLILVPALAGSADQSLSFSLLLMVLKGIGLFVFLLAVGKWLMPALFHEVSNTHSDELFVLTVLLVALTSAWITHEIGLSMALGAFIAGMMLGESHYRHQIEADIRPFRNILLGLFFVSVGMLLDLNVLLSNIHWVIVSVLVLMLVKFIMITALARLMGKTADTSIRTGIILAQGGEFGFALLALASEHELVGPSHVAIIIATVITSIVVTPMLIKNSGLISRRLLPKNQNIADDQIPHSNAALAEATAEMQDHVVICGFGRVGQTIARFLKKEDVPYIAVDMDTVRVHEASSAGEHVVYGDSSRHEILEALGVARARLVVVTVNDKHFTLQILDSLKHLAIEVPTLIRTKDDSDLELYQHAGATEVVPEVLEGGLMLVYHSLLLSNIPFRRVNHVIRSARSERYQLLRGYYHGTQSSVADATGTPLVRRHPVVLTENAWACGRCVGDLNLAPLGIEVSSLLLAADGQEISMPELEQILSSGDTVILTGLADHIEEAENRLLSR